VGVGGGGREGGERQSGVHMARLMCARFYLYSEAWYNGGKGKLERRKSGVLLRLPKRTSATCNHLGKMGKGTRLAGGKVSLVRNGGRERGCPLEDEKDIGRKCYKWMAPL